jgi:hypothetical protein
VPRNNAFFNFGEAHQSRNYVYISEAESDSNDKGGTFQPGTITAQIHDKNTSDDRYSDHEIISDHDLLGSTIQIRFCPLVFVNKRAPVPRADQENTTLDKLVRFDGAYVAFPGRQELPIMVSDNTHVKTTSDAQNHCTTMSLQVPQEEAEYRKLLLP